MKTRIFFVLIIVHFIFSCTKETISPDYSLTAPSNLTLEQINLESIQLNWQDNSSAEEGFRLDRKIGENNWEENYQILAENTITFIDSNLTIFDYYYYRVKAFINSDYSDYIESGINFLDLDSLSAPTNLALEQINLESIQLNWQDNSSAEEGFRIDRKIGENEWEENYQILSENSTTFIDSELITIDNYSYRVRAFANGEFSDFTEASIDFFYDDVSYIEPLYSGQISLNPLEPFEYQVALKDSNGNNVQRVYDVWFKFMSKPEGTNINNVLYNTTDSISVQSVGGVASVTLYAGNQSGTAAIKTYTYNSYNIEISIIKSNIIVHSLAPEIIELSIGGIDSGENLGNGNWGIEVSAIVTDIQGNPVQYGTAVWFSLPDNPGWASIEAGAYVGNVNANGDSLAGVAFTQLIYEGAHTNDSLLIQAEAGTCFETEEFIMPLQFPILDGTVVPQLLVWIENNPSYPDSLIATFMINLQDGQNNPIDNQQLIFYCDLGVPIDMGTDNDNNPFTENTGIVSNQHGRINKEWIFYR
ncbi:MAG: fibronectin type III domain-containing protein, partial [Candidatus Cloacimonetes bacterium]|nr:fibronectin type III domain-containing protein [Candidatus Cloacimonadota bacterium]